jgi:hypothetical protein
MAALVGGLSTASLQCEKLVAQIDESRSDALVEVGDIEEALAFYGRLFAIWLKPTARAFLASAMALSCSFAKKNLHAK